MVTIRPATADDIPRIVELVDDMTLTSSATENGATLETYRLAFAEMEANPGISLLVADKAGEVVGTVVLIIVPSLSHGGRPWAKVEHMVVVENLRGHGIGHQIMEYCIDRARKAGCYKIELTSDNRRPDAHRFYGSLGFDAAATGFRLYF